MAIGFQHELTIVLAVTVAVLVMMSGLPYGVFMVAIHSARIQLGGLNDFFAYAVSRDASGAATAIVALPETFGLLATYRVLGAFALCIFSFGLAAFLANMKVVRAVDGMTLGAVKALGPAALAGEVAMFVGWGAFIAYVLIRYRRSRNPVADYAGVRSHRSTYLEIGVAVVEAILLIGFAIPLWAARVDRIPPENEAVVVQVTAEQFAWNVRYAGPDGVFGKTDVKLVDLQTNPLGVDRSDPPANRAPPTGCGPIRGAASPSAVACRAAR